MCHPSIVSFVARRLDREQVHGKSVIELGSYGFCVRDLLESWGPASYLGIDIRKGPGVDLVNPVETILEALPGRKFDLVLSTELLEHVRDWPTAVHAMKTLCADGGRLLVTTRSEGFPTHGAPHDYWRFSVEDFRTIFKDMELLHLEPDKQFPGVFLDARRPSGFTEVKTDLSVYSMVLRRRGVDPQDPRLGDGGGSRMVVREWVGVLREQIVRPALKRFD